MTDNVRITPNMLKITLNIVEQLKSDPSGITFKEVLQTYLLASDPTGTLNTSHRYWAGQTGWPSTLIVLKGMRGVICHKRKGQKQWKAFILAEAKRIVKKEASRRWTRSMYPPHVAARAVRPDFFGAEKADQRGEGIRRGMDFLWRLIQYRLSSWRPGTAVQSENSEELSESSEEYQTISFGGSGEDDEDSSTMTKPTSSPFKLPAFKQEPEDSEWVDSDSSLDSTTSSQSRVEVKNDNTISLEAHDELVVDDNEDGDEDTNSESSYLGELEGEAYKRTGDRIDRLKKRFDMVCLSYVGFQNVRSAK
ncbi:hypothetical protein DFH28DRAFT_881183 [Melampsora americana]|nr:hypothetical protein DFH28DRAFT_881183 [Melampsora americana]